VFLYVPCLTLVHVDRTKRFPAYRNESDRSTRGPQAAKDLGRLVGAFFSSWKIFPGDVWNFMGLCGYLTALRNRKRPFLSPKRAIPIFSIILNVCRLMDLWGGRGIPDAPLLRVRLLLGAPYTGIAHGGERPWPGNSFWTASR